jgi:hypothetical protein
MTRQHPARILAALVLVGAGAGALAGCGDDEPSTEEATAEVCDARANLDDTLTQLGRLDPTDRSELAESQWNNVEDAWNNLQDTVNGLDQDTSFAEARQQLSSAGEELGSAWQEFTAQVEC